MNEEQFEKNEPVIGKRPAEQGWRQPGSSNAKE